MTIRRLVKGWLDAAFHHTFGLTGGTLTLNGNGVSTHGRPPGFEDYIAALDPASRQPRVESHRSPR